MTFEREISQNVGYRDKKGNLCVVDMDHCFETLLCPKPAKCTAQVKELLNMKASVQK